MKKVLLSLAAVAIAATTAMAGNFQISRILNAPTQPRQAVRLAPGVKPVATLKPGVTGQMAQGTVKETSSEAAGPQRALITHKWESIGTCQYTDDILSALLVYSDGSGVDPVTYEVEIEQDTKAGQEGYFRLVNPYAASVYPLNVGDMLHNPDEDVNGTPFGNRYIIIDATEPEYANFNKGDRPGLFLSDSEADITSGADWYIQYGNNTTKEDCKNAGMYGVYDAENGRITWGPSNGNILIFLRDEDTRAMGETYAYQVGKRDAISIILPGGKADPKVNYLPGYLDFDNNQAQLNFSVEGDVEYVMAASILASEFTGTNEQIQELINSADQSLMVPATDGVVNVDLSNFPAGKEVRVLLCGLVPSGEEGNYNVTLAQAEVFTLPEEEGWTTCAEKAILTEDFIAAQMGLDAATYEVPVQINSARQGVVRLVNPYGAETWPNAGSFIIHGHNHYMEFDINDADFVLVPMTVTGVFVNQAGGGDLVVASNAAMYLEAGYDKATIQNAGYLGGKLADGIVTFPGLKDMVLGMSRDLGANGMNLYYTNMSIPEGATTIDECNPGNFSLELPEEALAGINDIVNDAADATDAPAVYYNLQGMRVADPAAAPGLYIRVQGNNSVKQMVR